MSYLENAARADDLSSYARRTPAALLITFERDGGLLVIGVDFLEFFAGLGDEEQEMVFRLATEDLLGRLLGEFDAERQGILVDVRFDFFRRQAFRGQVVATLVEVFEEHDQFA